MCPHTPHWLRAASYVRSGHCSRVYALGCSRARCSCVVVTLARLGVTIFVSWLGVRCRAVTRPGLARHFLHHPAAPLPLQSRWFIRACCSSGDSLQHAQVQGVSLLCSDAYLAWCDDFRRLAGVRCRVVTRLDLARHFLHGPAQPSLLRPKWVIRTYPSAESSSQWPSTALMRGHAHTGGSPTVSKHSDAPRACPRAGKGRSRRSICPNVVASMPTRREGTPGSAKAQIRGHRSIAVGTPRGRLTECSEVAAAFDHWGERVEGSSTATWATCAAANSAPTRPWRAVPACCVNFCQVGLVCVREVTPWFPTRYFPSRRVPWSGEFIVGDDACV